MGGMKKEPFDVPAWVREQAILTRDNMMLLGREMSMEESIDFIKDCYKDAYRQFITKLWLDILQSPGP